MGETDEAVRELQVKQYELSKTFKSLKKLGLEGDCEIPQLVIVGMQSSGKSSVLKRISRVRLPTDNTRSVTEIILHRRLSPDAKITYKSLSSKSGQETLLTSDVKPEELAVNNLFPVIGKIHKDFLKEKANVTPKGYVLKIEIAGSKCPDMTLIELPGLRIPDKGES
ncbi:uncharacterized protein NFIA_022720 [Aspergillus fischeri NRRL 181]|uniref:Dynamin N-terminal domain-containing protein n=1 Tax=Neosartorya fischeri (strain ATCC 1020 / DSM 3700 / CBS 544.65 / FGSC A1164 / JCM 1740 / NRRL 181 / WB 181) TaxID=331117 RepID=A1D568_NEOFI|nr:uncharacterized protein NFIA_022720 [Aspergillus fischeri NRRL 181]EAW23561.1 hypothetical protein NFIA_022720 [Aspergillus fischeri NRRL 181]